MSSFGVLLTGFAIGVLALMSYQRMKPKRSPTPLTIAEMDQLESLAARLATQSAYHEANITMYFEIMVDAALFEFNEDNWPTLTDFLDECYERAKANVREQEDDKLREQGFIV